MLKSSEMLGIEKNNKILDPKSLIISGDVHSDMKNYCKTKGIGISWLVEKLYLDFKTKNELENYDK